MSNDIEMRGNRPNTGFLNPETSIALYFVYTKARVCWLFSEYFFWKKIIDNALNFIIISTIQLYAKYQTSRVNALIREIRAARAHTRK